MLTRRRASRKRLVINSHRFFRDISPGVLAEIGIVENSEGADPESEPELYTAIKNGNHQIIITDRIRQEYIRETRKEGFPILLVEPVIDRLKDFGLVIEPGLPGGRITFPGIPQYHNVFPITAILSKADYLITERDVWHSRSDIISQYGPMVISPNGFIRREGV